MKKIWNIVLPVVVVGISLWSGALLNLTTGGASAATQPGTSEDPVVTKSYVDKAIQQALRGENIPSPTPSPSPAPLPKDNDRTPPAVAAPVEVVTVKPGQKLIADAGTEFVVRAGLAVVYSKDVDGVTDLTDGIDIPNGWVVSKNHLLSFPREGRGLQVQPGNEYSLTVLVRGAYSLK
ncbi:hypothetical protein [Paenibacillus sanguinis]|uniref:hypothetical protein n=1 Tax=Paenibacillus sanguinis TaxID=225906 RepID=UPI0003714BD5|nr:hypothetical protein [Paenibacillus sanguinis]